MKGTFFCREERDLNLLIPSYSENLATPHIPKATVAVTKQHRTALGAAAADAAQVDNSTPSSSMLRKRHRQALLAPGNNGSPWKDTGSCGPPSGGGPTDMYSPEPSKTAFTAK